MFSFGMWLSIRMNHLLALGGFFVVVFVGETLQVRVHEIQHESRATVAVPPSPMTPKFFSGEIRVDVARE